MSRAATAGPKPKPRPPAEHRRLWDGQLPVQVYVPWDCAGHDYCPVIIREIARRERAAAEEARR